MTTRVLTVATLFTAAIFSGCAQRECRLDDPNACSADTTCEAVQNRTTGLCLPPVVVEGKVFDLASKAGIEGAQVTALDANGAPVGAGAVTAADGTYKLRVPSTRTDEQGNFVARKVLLRAQAKNYVPFPSGTRVSLPLDTADATRADANQPWVKAGGLADIGLQALPAGEQGRPAVRGKVEVSGDQKGVLVALEPATGMALTTIPAADGTFVVFNVPAGTWQAQAYSRGYNYTSVPVTVASADVAGVDLKKAGTAAATMGGQVQLVAGANNAGTSVVMVLESTFNASLVRGEVPPGLRAPEPGVAPNISGAYSITGIPDGKYVVLAAFENDDNVRDPDPGISGTQIQHVTVTAGAVSVNPSFKVTGAVKMVGPGAGDTVELITGSPTFRWEAYSNADGYQLVVLDALGNKVWENLTVPAGSTSLAYGGPALEAGRTYQWRVTAMRRGAPTSMTEDLRGLFQLQ